MKHEHEEQAVTSETAPAEPKTPELGTMVQYADIESGAVCPAMVIGVHVDGTVDLRVHFGYSLGTHDRQNVALSDLGAPGTYMETLPKKDREAKIKAAVEKKAKEQEQANAEAEAARKELAGQASR
jgi:hypothetical protein